MKIQSIITHLFLLLTLLSCLTAPESGLVEAKKKSKGKIKKPKRPKKPVYPEISSPERPEEINEWHYCFACLAMSDFAIGRLRDRESEADILEVIEPANICNSEKYKGNPDVDLKGVNPIIITDACTAIIASYEDELVATLKKRYAFVRKDQGKKLMVDHARN